MAGELAALSLVDLYLNQRAKLEYVDARTGEHRIVGKASETSPSMLLAAKAFRITILAQTTR